jgi:hypothetical protein
LALATIPLPLFSGNPDTINLHVLMVLSIGEVINAMLFPEMLISDFCSTMQASDNQQNR